MDLKEQTPSPINLGESADTFATRKEKVTDILNWQQQAQGAENLLRVERIKHDRARQACRRLQTQLDNFIETSTQTKRLISQLNQNNSGLS